MRKSKPTPLVLIVLCFSDRLFISEERLPVTFMSKNTNEINNNLRHFYDEHYCPSNLFRNVEWIINIKTGAVDEHGLFKYIGFIEIDPIASRDRHRNGSDDLSDKEIQAINMLYQHA